MIGIFIILSFSLVFTVILVKAGKKKKKDRENGWKGPISHPYMPKDKKREIEDDLGMPESSIVPEPFPIEEAERDLKKALPSDYDDIIYINPDEEGQALAYEEDMQELEQILKSLSPISE
jgi:hypothetical protein